MQTHISLTHLSSDTLKHPPLSPERDLPSWIPKKFQKQAIANRQVYGMEVVVVPWLSGMLPLHSDSFLLTFINIH